MILVIDNYDSFVHNLARYLTELGCETEVARNDAVDIASIRRRRPEAIVLSPGPCTPSESGICLEVVRELAGEIPILGVCLGHQAIAQACGARIVRATEPMHGRTSPIHHDESSLFSGLPNPLTAARYHSLIVHEASLPRDLIVTARCDNGVIMAIEHRQRPLLVGVQFHPESVLTTGGHTLLGNFLSLAGIAHHSPGSTDFTPPRPVEDFYTRMETGAAPPPIAIRPAR